MATLLVVVIHCAPWPSHATRGADSFYSGLSLMSLVSVPLFVILSGLLLTYSHGADRPQADFWARRLRRTLLPWLAWVAIYFALTVEVQGMSPAPAADWGWWAGGGGHLYFLILIPQLYLLYLIWPKGRSSSVVAMGLAVAFQVTLQLLRVVLPLHSGFAQILLLDYGFEEAPFWIGYFAIGVVLGVHPDWLLRGRRWRWLAVPATFAAGGLLLAGLPGRIATNWGPWVGGTGGFLRPSLVLLTTLVFFDLWWLSAILEQHLRIWPRRTVTSLSRHSLGIYIIHPIFLLGAGPLLEITPRPLSLQEGLPWSLLPFGVLVLGAMCFGWITTAQLASHRSTAWVVGESSRPAPRPLPDQGLMG